MNTTIIKHGFILAAFALFTTAVIALTFQVTRDKIEEQVMAKKLASLNDVIPKSMHDNTLYADCIEITDKTMEGIQQVYRSSKGGQINGFAIETTAKNGYSGDIDILLGVTLDLKVTGVRVLRHKETPGLGDKIELSVSDWILAFNNQTYSKTNQNLWRVKKDGGQYDQFTGATITPRAVVNTLADTLNWMDNNMQQLLTQSVNCSVEA